MNQALLSWTEAVVRISVPLLLASIAALYTERVRVLNVAVEGLMSLGAFAAVLVGGLSGSWLAGCAAAILVGTVFSVILSVAKRRLGADPFVAALAVNFLAAGLIQAVMEGLFGTKGNVRFPDFTVPSRPFPGFPADALALACLVVFLIFSVLLEKSRLGLRIRALGGAEIAVSVADIQPARVEGMAFALSGGLSALAGAALALPLGVYVPNSVAGRGWIALVLVYVGGKTPWGIALASVAFALALNASNVGQAALSVPAELLLAFPSLTALGFYCLAAKGKRR